MTEIACPTCGAGVAVEERPGSVEWMTTRCARCGERIRYCVGSPAATSGVAFDPVIEYPPGPRPEGTAAGDAYSTAYHPRAALGFDVGEPEAAGTPETPGGPSETSLAGPESAPPPALPAAAASAHFLVLGAAPGRERIPLRSARTVFGRRDADVDLDDAAMSRRHFQVEAAGREFFLRDLGSRNGTFVNGARVGYTELLDGDEVHAGRTFLVFRTSAVGPGRRSTQGS